MFAQRTKVCPRVLQSLRQFAQSPMLKARVTVVEEEEVEEVVVVVVETGVPATTSYVPSSLCSRDGVFDGSPRTQQFPSS